jgi:cobalt-zinc-cadmium efflux system protein
MHTHPHERSALAAGARWRRSLATTLALSAAYMVAEVVGVIVANSLALLADAGHMLTDVAALGLSLFAMWAAQRPVTRERTYGYHRIEILAALSNGATLVAIAILILVEAVRRWRNPPAVAGGLMVLVACGGLVVNLVALRLLRGGRRENLNVRGVWLHVLTDALGSVQAIAAGALIAAFGWRWADPVASVLIAILVAYSSWGLLRDAVGVLMEGAPGGLDVDEVGNAIMATPGVRALHDLHVWTIASGFVALSAHVVVEPDCPDNVLWHICAVLRERFDITHSTIQVERENGRALPVAVKKSAPE